MTPSQPLGVHDGKDWTKPENWPALVGKRVMMISGLGAYYGTLKRHSPLWCVDNRGGLREESIKLIEPIDTPKTDMTCDPFTGMSTGSDGVGPVFIPELEREPIDTPKTDMITKFKKGDKVGPFTFEKKLGTERTPLFQFVEPCGQAVHAFSFDVVASLVETYGVTPPPPVPIVHVGMTRTSIDGSLHTSKLPLEWAGKETKTVLSEDVLATIKCHANKSLESTFTDNDEQWRGKVISQLPGDNFTVLVLKGDS